MDDVACRANILAELRFRWKMHTKCVEYCALCFTQAMETASLEEPELAEYLNLAKAVSGKKRVSLSVILSFSLNSPFKSNFN